MKPHEEASLPRGDRRKEERRDESGRGLRHGGDRAFPNHANSHAPACPDKTAAPCAGTGFLEEGEPETIRQIRTSEGRGARPWGNDGLTARY